MFVKLVVLNIYIFYNLIGDEMMQRYFAVNKNLKISDKDKHHIINVMRMKPNDKIEIVYDEIIYLCRINNITKNNIDYDVVKQISMDNELNCKVTIAIPLINEKKLDFVLQKCTELGVYDFVIYDCERSKVKVNDKVDKKLERWNLITKEAAEQSFRNISPKVYGITTLKNMVNFEHNLKLVASTKKVEKTIKNVLQNSTNCDKILIVVGPEGGLSEKEENYLLENEFLPITFGNTILRCETAPMFIMSAIKYETMR